MDIAYIKANITTGVPIKISLIILWISNLGIRINTIVLKILKRLFSILVFLFIILSMKLYINLVNL